MSIEFAIEVIRLPEQTTPGITADVGKLYTKDESGVTELFYLKDDGTEVQLSDNLRLVLYERIGNPPSITDAGQLYTKDDAGVTQLYYEASDGTVYQVTPPIAVLPSILPLPGIVPVPPTVVNTAQMFCNLDGAAYQARVVDDLGVVSQYSGDAFFTTVRTGGPTGPRWSSGAGTPEGVLVGNVGDLYSDTAGGAGTTFYVKESGAGNTGWVAK